MNQEDAVEDFIDAIIRDANSGRTFVPFIGSGLSSPSGIIMGMEFTNYLAFTTYLVLCDPTSRLPTHGEGRAAHWDLSEQGWPPLPSSTEAVRAKKWILQKFTSICDKLELRINYTESTHQIQSLVPTRKNRSALDDIVSSISQPPIPMILRDSSAKADEERLMQFRKVVSQGDSGQPLTRMPPWMHHGVSYGDAVVETGIRALADWRETLSFLAMCKVEHGDPTRLTIQDLDPSIIDNFNATITRDKRPNLGHKIISHLSEPLRVNTLLTTNFDTLTEEAYKAMSIPLTVLPVSSRGDLPHPRTVGAFDSLVKLHGESHDTRADLSLDDEPSDEDKATFSAYMQRGTGHLLRRRSDGEEGHSQRSSRLLVVGYSGNDHRCVQMIKHWLEITPDHPRVYWICFSPGDYDRVGELFGSLSFSEKVVRLQTPRPDLLLYELYQRLTLALPPGGLTYEFSHVLPPSRRESYDHSETEVRKALKAAKFVSAPRDLLATHSRRLLRDAVVMFGCETILEAVKEGGVGGLQSCQLLGDAEAWKPSYRFANLNEDSAQDAVMQLRYIPTVINLSGGAVRACALASVKLLSRQYRKVFWIELQDYLDVDSMLRDFLRSFALRFGQFQARHVTMHPFAEGLPVKFEKQSGDRISQALQLLVKHFRDIMQEYRVDPDSVVVMFCGRDSYGNGAGIVPSTWKEGDALPFQQLHFVIETLGQVGVPTVYFPCTEARSQRKKNLTSAVAVHSGLEQDKYGPAVECNEKDGLWPFDPYFAVSSNSKSTTEAFAAELSVFRDIIASTLGQFFDVPRKSGESQLTLTPKDGLQSDDVSKLEFLYALTLFRHSRHMNAISSDGAYPCPYRFQSCAIDNDFVRSMQVKKWISELHKNRVFFTKPGGALWMHRDIRETIHSAIERMPIPDFGRRQHWTFRETRGRLHFWIGDWYRKAFCSSGHLTPIIESIYHLLSSAIYSQFAVPKSPTAKWEEGPNLLTTHRHMMFESAVIQASKVLLLGWNSIELWQASPANVAWLSEKHREIVKSALTSVLNTISPSAKQSTAEEKKARRRLDDCVDEFCGIHNALEFAVILEGGRSKRGATSWSSREAIMMKLIPRRSRSTKPIDLPHGIEEIRRPLVGGKNSFSELISKAFKKADALELWQTLEKAADGRPESRSDFGRDKTKWKASAGAEVFQNTIWVLSEAAYVLLRRAKLEFHAKGTVSRPTWLLSTLCCNLGIDLCKHLPAWSLGYEVQSRIKIHCIYGVGLANLGRFFEANRHLNEAQALQSKWKDGSTKDQAIIAIRRAEVKLTECYWISLFLCAELDLSVDGKATITKSACRTKETFLMPPLQLGATGCWESRILQSLLDENEWNRNQQRVIPPNIFECIRQSKPVGLALDQEQVRKWREASQVRLRSQFSALLDEAVRSLEIAEKCLGGVVQSSLWWSRLHTLRLRVYGLLAHIPLDAELSIIFRKQSADHGIFKGFLSAVRIAGQDDFRRLRALRYFTEANRWYCQYRDPDEFNATGSVSIEVLKKYLPESLLVAQDLANQLKQDNVNSSVPEVDLLRLAVLRCINRFPELKS